MNPSRAILWGAVGAVAGGAAATTALSGWAPVLAGAVAGAGVLASLAGAKRDPAGERSTIRLAADPAALLRRRNALVREVEALEATLDLQRGVFEVSAELVGCVEEADARARFAGALRRYWDCRGADLMVWERGAWRSLGGEVLGPPPDLAQPVQLPEEAGGDLVLDLSPAVAGQAALVLRGARPQPTLRGLDRERCRAVAEVLRGQFALSLRRVVLFAELQALARIDPLTGTHRRWYGEMRLRELVEGGQVVSVAMVDIDFFKRINDEHGHAAGDRVLAAVGRSLVAQLRREDLVARMGGEEFLCILSETPPTGAELVANRLRQAVSQLADLPARVTISIGVAACHQDETVEHLLLCADEALYQAKSGGRDRVVLSANPGDGSALRTTSRPRK